MLENVCVFMRYAYNLINLAFSSWSALSGNLAVCYNPAIRYLGVKNSLRTYVLEGRPNRFFRLSARWCERKVSRRDLTRNRLLSLSRSCEKRHFEKKKRGGERKEEEKEERTRANGEGGADAESEKEEEVEEEEEEEEGEEEEDTRNKHTHRPNDQTSK